MFWNFLAKKCVFVFQNLLHICTFNKIMCPEQNLCIFNAGRTSKWITVHLQIYHPVLWQVFTGLEGGIPALCYMRMIRDDFRTPKITNYMYYIITNYMYYIKTNHIITLHPMYNCITSHILHYIPRITVLHHMYFIMCITSFVLHHM